MLKLKIGYIQKEDGPSRWYNGNRTRVECGRSWVRPPVASTEDIRIGICFFSAYSQHLGVTAMTGRPR